MHLNYLPLSVECVLSVSVAYTNTPKKTKIYNRQNTFPKTLKISELEALP